MGDSGWLTVLSGDVAACGEMNRFGVVHRG